MANTTIHTLSYNLVMNAEKFQAGSIASKKELAAGKKLFMETRTDAERYGAAVDHLGDLLRKGSIDQDTYARSLKKIQDQQKSATASTKGMSTAFAGVKTQLSALLPVITAAGVIGGLKNTTDQIDNTAKAARKFGVDFNDLRQIQYAAAIDTSLSTEQLGKSLQKMSIFVSDVGVETDKAMELMGGLNIEADELVGKGIQQQFLRIADGIAGVADENDRLAMAQDVFGKSGADLIPLLEKGSGSIKQLADEHERLLGTLSEAQTAKVENLNDSLTRLSTSFERLSESVAVVAAGPLGKLVNQLTAASMVLSGESLTSAGILASGTKGVDVASATALAKSRANRMTGGMTAAINEARNTVGFDPAPGISIARDFINHLLVEGFSRADVMSQQNASLVKLAPESIEAINNGEIQSERRTRLD